MYKIYRNDVETLNPSFKEKGEIVSCLIDNRLANLDEEPEMWRECESLEDARKELSYLETYVSKISGPVHGYKIEQYYIAEENKDTVDVIDVSKWQQYDIIEIGSEYIFSAIGLGDLAEYMNDEIREDMHTNFEDYNTDGEWLTEYVNRDPDFEDLLRQEFNVLDM
jgi:hypothetical protein